MTAPLTPARRLRSIFSGSVGNLVEWYDWYVYAAFSLYFAGTFFPQGDRTSQCSVPPPCLQSASGCARSVAGCSAARTTATAARRR